MTTLKNLTIYTEDGIIENGYISFDALITKIGQGDVEGIDMKGKLLIPGFIDQHIHGALGHDAMDGSYEGLEAIATYLPREGTTSFLATTMTESKENIKKALQNIATYKETSTKVGADIIGVHLEGPFISKKYKGAQREEAIQEVSIALFDEYNKASNNLIKEVTIAPELEGAMELISYLTSKGIVSSIGHSNASGDQALEAVENGAACFTHSYNASSPLHHRNIGVVGSMFLSEAYAELICDCVHSSKNAVKLLYKIKSSDKTILITDSMRAKALDDGEYELGGQNVFVKGNQARLENGVLAGSVLLMKDAVKNIKEITDCSMEDIIKMASMNPAKLQNVFDTKGSIRVGKDADLLVVDKDLNIQEVYCKGRKTV